MPKEEYMDVPMDEMDDHFREIVREEIASLAGKALRRSQDRNYTRSPERNLAIDVANEEFSEFWGEVLAEYGKGTPIMEGDEVVGYSFRNEEEDKE